MFMIRKYAHLSQTQLGIYLECLQLKNTFAYNTHVLVIIDKSIDMKQLARAIEKAVKVHPYMFVKIAEVDGYHQQILENVEDYHQEVLKISESEWQETLSKLLDQPIELIGGRLFQFYFVETEKAKYFFRKCHHIIFDGMAYRTLFDDISVAYDGKELLPENYDSIDFANDELIARSQ